MQNELLRNLPGNTNWEGSFYERLTEYCKWDIAAFWKLHLDLLNIAKETSNSKCIDRELALAVVTLKSKVSSLINSHYNKNDIFKIEDITPDELIDFTERFDQAILSVFSGEIIPETSFDLVNPLIQRL